MKSWKQLCVRGNSMKRKRTIWFRVLIPLAAAVVMPLLLVQGAMSAKGVVRELKSNELNILKQKVLNRAEYLNDSMKRWSSLDAEMLRINSIAEAYYKENGQDFSGLETDETLYQGILKEAVPELIELMRKNGVNGAFLILSTKPPEKSKDGQVLNGSKPAVYLRDLDAVSEAPRDNSDLLAKRMPANIGRAYGIANDFDWNPIFKFQEWEQGSYDFFLKPYLCAMERSDWESRDLGYWDCFTLQGDVQPVISYSVPLKLSDGTVYGVMGVDITVDYLKKNLNYLELNEDRSGAYILGDLGEDGVLKEKVICGPFYDQLNDEETAVLTVSDSLHSLDPEVYCLTVEQDQKFYGYIRTLWMYDNNSPLEDEGWVLGGVVRNRELFEFPRQVQGILRGISVFCLIADFFITLTVTWFLSKPIMKMADSVRNSSPNRLVRLPDTNIRELDELGSAIQKLSEDVFDASKKFSRIMELASVEIGVFEADMKLGKIYFSENFFTVFGEKNTCASEESTEEFFAHLRQYDEYIMENDDQHAVYCLKPDGMERWVRLCIIRTDGSVCGLAENVTRQMQEIKKIEYERDYDVLTGLLNRRAFANQAKELLGKGEEFLKKAAMLMMDMDNLKHVNDTYGHDWGDKYLQLQGMALKKYLPEGTLIGRVSGDEFIAFLYGYSTEKALQDVLAVLERQLGEEYLVLPDRQNYKLRMSGGYAWYGKDAAEYDLLVKYADFAMYKIKNSVKGRISYFDSESYRREAYLLKNKEELNRLIEEKRIKYYFQPIVEVETGRIYAYEGLMHSTLDSISGVEEILSLARQESKLGEIEKLTWFETMNSFVKWRSEESSDKECHIFINSIPNQMLCEEDCARFAQQYGDALSLIVQEITEDEKLNLELQDKKRSKILSWGAQTALDDYGAGYNSQSTLISLNVEFIKLDISFISDIHLHEKKQSIVNAAVTYAHNHNIKVIAEGVEKREELEVLTAFHVDYIQGYYIGRPSEEPEPVESAKLEELRNLYLKYKK